MDFFGSSPIQPCSGRNLTRTFPKIERKFGLQTSLLSSVGKDSFGKLQARRYRGDSLLSWKLCDSLQLSSRFNPWSWVQCLNCGRLDKLTWTVTPQFMWRPAAWIMHYPQHAIMMRRSTQLSWGGAGEGGGRTLSWSFFKPCVKPDTAACPMITNGPRTVY